MNGNIIKFEYCGKTYQICINKVRAFLQDMSAMMIFGTDIYNIPKVVGIDIGGFTTDYLVMRSGLPDLEHCDSLEKGVISMYNQIKSIVNSEYDLLLEEVDIDSIIEGKTEYYDEAVVQIVEDKVQDYVVDLLNSIRERNVDTKSSYSIFIGGGALLLKRFIEKYDRLGKHVFMEDICANAKGYDAMFRAYENRM